MNFKYFLFFVLTLILIGIATKAYISNSIATDMRNTKKIMIGSSFVCSNDCVVKIEVWGPYGYSRYCQKGNIRHGKWEAWEKERLVISGDYSNGTKTGTWTWYNKDGTVDKIEHH